jgi:hypothetical protein
MNAEATEAMRPGTEFCISIVPPRHSLVFPFRRLVSLLMGLCSTSKSLEDHVAKKYYGWSWGDTTERHLTDEIADAKWGGSDWRRGR